MKRISFFTLFAAVLIAASCADHRMDGMVPDSVYITRYGLTTEDSYNFGQGVRADVWTFKSGISSESAIIRYGVNPELILKYNEENGTSYALLPDNCYDFDGPMEFRMEGDEMHAKFSFTYYPDAIVEASGGVYEDARFLLPLQIRSTGVAVSERIEGGDFALVEFLIRKPDINILSDDFSELALWMGMDGISEYAFNLGLPVKTTDEVNFTFYSHEDNEAELQAVVDSYNATFSTSYSLLPADAYSITSPLTVAAGSDKATVNFGIDQSKVPFGKWMAVFKLESVDSPIFAGTDTEIVLPIDMSAELLDREGWIASASSSNESGSRLPEYVIDGDLETYWHIRFKAEAGGQDLERWFQLELPEEKIIRQIQIEPRTTGNQITGYTIYTSDDPEALFPGEWVDHGYYPESDKAKTKLLLTLPDNVTTRYVRLRMNALEADNSIAINEINLLGSY